MSLFKYEEEGGKDINNGLDKQTEIPNNFNNTPSPSVEEKVITIKISDLDKYIQNNNLSSDRATLAIISLICGLLAIFFAGFIFVPIGIIFLAISFANEDSYGLQIFSIILLLIGISSSPFLLFVLERVLSRLN